MKKFILIIVLALILSPKEAGAQVRALTYDSFFQKIYDKNNGRFINQNGIVIDFYASWCKPCHRMRPIFDDVSGEFYNYYFYRVDAEAEEELSEIFGIGAYPTIIYIPPYSANGKYFQSTGVIERKELRRNVKKYLKK